MESGSGSAKGSDIGSGDTVALGDGTGDNVAFGDRKNRLAYEYLSRKELYPTIGKPWNADVSAMLTDFYQVTMAYTYWLTKKADDWSVFEVYFRTCPFKGEFAVFAGVGDVLRLLNTFGFQPADVAFLKSLLPHCQPQFFDYLLTLDCSKVVVDAVPEGRLVFAREPVMTVSGPLIVCQLLETAILSLLNFPSLVATNAARYRIAAGPRLKLLEFGMRRAQGPDGGITASRYAFLGGFDATSNLRAAYLFRIPCGGTHAHSFVTSFASIEDYTPTLTNHTTNLGEASFGANDNGGNLSGGTLPPSGGRGSGDDVRHDFLETVLRVRTFCLDNWEKAQKTWSQKEGELSSFVAYAQAMPLKFTALVDTYDVISSGAPNYACVAIALALFGYPVGGCRLDSGDLAYLSVKCRHLFNSISEFIWDRRQAFTAALKLPLPGDTRDTRDTSKGVSSVKSVDGPSADTDVMVVDAVSDDGEGDCPDGFLLKQSTICASNSINEQVLLALAAEGHEINLFGIGTHLVTCQNQPSLGMVYKMCEINKKPAMKISQDIAKSTLPFRKQVYRLYDREGTPLLDLMQVFDADPPTEGERVYCQDVLDATKRCFVIPDDEEIQRLRECRARCKEDLNRFRPDIFRFTNPTPYRTSASREYADLYRELWSQTAPMRTFS